MGRPYVARLPLHAQIDVAAIVGKDDDGVRWGSGGNDAPASQGDGHEQVAAQETRLAKLEALLAGRSACPPGAAAVAHLSWPLVSLVHHFKVMRTPGMGLSGTFSSILRPSP